MTIQEQKQVEKLQKQVAIFTEKLKDKADTISNKTKDYRFGSNLSKVVDKLLIFNLEIQNIQLMEKQKK